ncbi:sensor histidine kinase [Pontibacter oryzae]|uniref:histidine kinase n=1 Tax=Pontibacter oryzae TaxID=2304593 RepID=A0A399SHG9_9BACT|nr:HAMP domain-containing sensor histidine kinase [Pontibacter oryzae]RIJ41963.1 sensor histidine kinase [Pontibacter oryzae]
MTTTPHPCLAEKEQLQKEFEEFSYIVSHDLKAPIRAISNLSAWIEEDLGEDLSPDVKQNIDLLRNRTARLERMIEALLQFSRATRTDMEIVPVSVSELIDELRDELPENVGLNLPEELPEFITYKLKLKQVLRNIMQNAVTFTDKNQPCIFVAWYQQDGMITFSIADDGQGIPEDAYEKIFSLFYTVSPKDALDTVGAGLAISKKIVQFVGGSIRAEANQHGGTTVHFSWPSSIQTLN